MSHKIERRVTHSTELRADPGGKRLSGYAAKYGTRSCDLGGWTEILQKGCFTSALASPDCDVRALYSHDTAMVLGRQKSGSLTLREDEVGLAFSLELPDTSLARDLSALVKRGDISGMSFGFTVAPDGQQWTDEQGNSCPNYCGTTRTVTKVQELLEVSVCAFPAYEATSVIARSKAGKAEAEARKYLAGLRHRPNAATEAARQAALKFVRSIRCR